MSKLYYPSHVLLIVIAAMSVSFIPGCKKGAEDFFTGRPSDIAMLHGRISAGDAEAMVELLRVPARFSDATESHIANWQGFITVWWQYPDKRDQIIASFGKLTSEEMQALRTWLLMKNRYLNKEKALALDEIAAIAKSPRFVTNDPVRSFIYGEYAVGNDYFINGNKDTFIFRCVLTKEKDQFDGVALSEISIWGNRTGPWEIFKKRENGSFELVGTDIVADISCLEHCRTKVYLSSGRCTWARGWPKQ